MFLVNIIYDKNHLNTFIMSRGEASRILPIGQYSSPCCLQANLTHYTARMRTLFCDKVAEQGRGLQCFANKKRPTTRADLFLLVEHQGLEPWTDRL